MMHLTLELQWDLEPIIIVLFITDPILKFVCCIKTIVKVLLIPISTTHN